jgi:hypothetical protein
MNFKEKVAQKLKEKQKNYKVFQDYLTKEKLNEYNFEVIICDPEKEKFNTDRGFFTSAQIYFKGDIVASVEPDFSFNSKIISMWLDLRSFRQVLNTINYSYLENNKEEFKYKRDKHKNIQTILDELEKIRLEIIKYYTAL